MMATSIPFSRPTDGGAGVASRQFRIISEARFVFSLIEPGIHFEVDRLRREKYGLIGEVSVTCNIPGARTVDGVLYAAEMNLSSTRSRQEFARVLEQRSKARELGWDLLVDEFTTRAIAAERLGQPAIVLRDMARPEPDEELTVDGFRFPRRHPSIVFGDGGTAKTYLALYIAGVLERQGLPVAFFDWELDERALRDRLERLFPGDMPGVRYVRCSRPLIFEVDRLHRIVQDNAIEFAVFDSVGFATAGPPESAEAALGYFRAVRQIGIGSLHTAHITKGENADQRPFGSSFWHNAARSTWFVKLSASASDGREISIGLINRKANLGPMRPAVGYAITFEQDRTRFERVDVASVSELAESLPLWQRMKHALKAGPRTLASLADDLGANVETLDRTVRRKNGLFTRVADHPDGITRIALLEKAS